LSTRIAQVAELAEVHYRAGGIDASLSAVARRAGTAFDPEVADAFRRHAQDVRDAAEEPSPWASVLAVQPSHDVTEETVDAFAAIAADFVDLKSPWLAGHSPAVATLALRAAEELGLPAHDRTSVHRAALLHDLGRVAIPNQIWEKCGPLTDGERELVRLHPYHGERILTQSEALAPLGRIAGAHHETLDGSGYHRGTKGAAMPMAARLIAIADRYAALVADRPHRKALAPAQAAATLRAEARDGKLDAGGVEAVIAASGQRATPPTHLADRLTPRELEVLRLVARGRSKAEVAEVLGISPHTADHHVRHVYQKIGVRTRAAATLYAMEHGLLDPLIVN
jgi:putative nucleotidyltransferase with HDIG domain